jgi:hypothetical protein
MRTLKYHGLFNIDLTGAVDNAFNKNLIGFRYPELAFVFDMDLNYVKRLSPHRWESFEELAESQTWIIDYKNSPDSFKVNSLLFRSDEFIRNHKGKHILFSGCSNTYGYGLYNHETWPWTVYNKIKEKEEVSGYYNIAVPGTGVFEIVSNIFKYMNMYRKPDVIFINIPHPGRFYSLLLQSRDKANIEFSEEFKLGQVIRSFRANKEMKLDNAQYYNSIYNYYKSESDGEETSHAVVVEKYIHVYQYLMMLEVFCKLNGIQLYIYSHNKFSNLFLSQTDLSSFKVFDKDPETGKDFEVLMSEYILNNKNDKFAMTARDNVHGGTAYHYAWASQAYDWYASKNYVK